MVVFSFLIAGSTVVVYTAMALLPLISHDDIVQATQADLAS